MLLPDYVSLGDSRTEERETETKAQAIATDIHVQPRETPFTLNKRTNNLASTTQTSFTSLHHPGEGTKGCAGVPGPRNYTGQ